MKKYVLLGGAFSVVVGLVYVFVLHEPGALFYPFAALAFLGGPAMAGVGAAVQTRKRKVEVFLAAGGIVFGVVLALFVVMYAVVPQFEWTSVRLPAECDGSAIANVPVALAYELPENLGAGILVASDGQTAVVAKVATTAPYPSVIYIVNVPDKRILQTLDFPNDVIMAALDDEIVVLYNDKLGALLDARTGAFRESILLIDNYGGLSESDRPILMGTSDGHWYVETSAIISSWGVEGSVRSRPMMYLNAVARGCFVKGATGGVTKLSDS